MLYFWPVQRDEQVVGSVFLSTKIEPLVMRIARYGGIMLLVMIASLLITVEVK